MILTVEPVRHAGGFPAGIDGLVRGHFDLADLLRQVLVRIPASEGIAFPRRGFIQLHHRVPAVALGIIFRPSVGFVSQRVARGGSAAATAAGHGINDRGPVERGHAFISRCINRG